MTIPQEQIDRAADEHLVPDGGYLHLNEHDVIDAQDLGRVNDEELKRFHNREVDTDVSVLDPEEVSERLGYRASVPAVLQAGEVQLWVLDLRDSDAPAGEAGGRKLTDTFETSSDFVLVNPAQVHIARNSPQPYAEGHGYVAIPDRNRRERPVTFGHGAESENGNSVALNYLGVSDKQFDISSGGAPGDEKIIIMERGSRHGTHLLTADVTRPEPYTVDGDTAAEKPQMADEVDGSEAARVGTEARLAEPEHVTLIKDLTAGVRSKVLELSRKRELRDHESALIDRTVKLGSRAVVRLLERGFYLPPITEEDRSGAAENYRELDKAMPHKVPGDTTPLGVDPADTRDALRVLAAGGLSVRREPVERMRAENAAANVMPLLATMVEYNAQFGRNVDLNDPDAEPELYAAMSRISASMDAVRAEEARQAQAEAEARVGQETQAGRMARTSDVVRETVRDLIAKGVRATETEAGFLRYASDGGRWIVGTALDEGMQLPPQESDAAYAAAMQVLLMNANAPGGPGELAMYHNDRDQFGYEPRATARVLNTIRIASAETLRYDVAERQRAERVAEASMTAFAAIARFNGQNGNDLIDSRISGMLVEMDRQRTAVERGLKTGPVRVHRLSRAS